MASNTENAHKRVLSRSRSYLEENLEVKFVMDILLSKQVITEKQRQTIEVHKEQFMQVRKLVDILTLLPARTFVDFCDCCKNGDYGHVHDRLKEGLAVELGSLGVSGEDPLYGAISGTDFLLADNVSSPSRGCIETSVLKRMQVKLDQEKQLFLALSGIHAVGKTQLCYLFCKRAKDAGHIVHRWEIDCTQKNSLDTGLQELLKELHVKLKEKETTLSCLNKLAALFGKTPGRNLLILDDVTEDTIDMVTEIKQRLKNTIIIATTNDATLFDGEESIEVKGFSTEEAITFLKQGDRLKKESESEMLKLAEFLGFSPYALDIASSYIFKWNLKIDLYISKLNNSTSLMAVEDNICKNLNRFLNTYKRQKSFFQVLELSITTLRESLGKDMFGVIEMFAFLNAGYIPFWLLREACRQKCDDGTDDANEENLRELVNGLKESSIVIKDDFSDLPVEDQAGRLCIHRGVQLAIRLLWRDQEAQEELVRQNVIKLLFPFLRRHIVYQEDFLQNSKLIAIIAPYLPQMAKEITKEYMNTNFVYCLKFVHVLDAITMTYIYRGLLDCNTEVKDKRNVKLERENTAEEFVNAAIFLMESLTGVQKESSVEYKRQKSEELENDECKIIMERIESLTKDGKFTRDMVKEIILDKYYEEKDFVPVWKRKCEDLEHYEGKFRISECEMEELQQKGIILSLSKMVHVYIAELYMSVLYTKARIYVYKLRLNKSLPVPNGHHLCFVDTLRLAQAIGRNICAKTGVHLMYEDRITIKGLHSIYIETATTDDTKLEEVATESITIARNENPAYEFGVLFRYKGKTMCNFTIYCLRQAVNAHKAMKQLNGTYKNAFKNTKMLIDEIQDMLQNEDEQFLGRGAVYILLASVMAQSTDKDDLENAWNFYVEAMEAERKNDKWNFAWRDGLNGLTALAKRLNTKEHIEKAKNYLREYTTILNGGDLSDLRKLMKSLELNDEPMQSLIC